MKKQLKLTVIFTFVFCSYNLSNAQDINNFAGIGAGGFSGDGGAATLAQINPASIARDNSGNTYIVDNWNYRIRKINAAGIITTFAGTGTSGFSGDGGQATNAQINPSYVTTDASGNVYISGDSRIRKVNSSGIISTIAGTGVGGFSGDGGLAINAQLNCPAGLAFDLSGNIYLADACNYRLRKINNSGVISTIAGIGTFGSNGDGGPAINAQVYSPSGIVVDATGNIFFTDVMLSKVRKINTLGIISTVAGVGGGGFNGDGIPATIAQLNGPSDLVLDAAGNMYIADASNHRIRKVNSAGIISTFAGTGVAGWSGDGGAANMAQLKNPMDIDKDNSGNFYISDAGNYRIRKISPTVPTPSICLVTVDSLGNNNEIYWEKTLFPQADTFIVLRETNALVYTPIARISKNAFSSYVDTNRHTGFFNGNPNTTSYKYKLQIKDTAGQLSALSPYHQSIFISDAQTGNFSWNYYFIEGIGNVQTTSYILWRHDLLSGISTTVGGTSASNFFDSQYSTLAQTGNVKWFVSTLGFNCNPSLKTVAGKTRTKSNNTNEKQFPTGLQMEVFGPDFIRLFPNPAVSKVTVLLSSKVQDLEYKLVDVSGRVILENKLNAGATEVNVEELPKGIYFINIFQSRSFIITKKIIIVD